MKNTGGNLAGLLALGALSVAALPAAAQIVPDSQEIHLYGGQAFGDDLTDGAVSGQTPQLDDDITYGIRYGYNFSQSLGLELSLGQNANKVTGAAGGESDLDLTTFDVDAVWHFNPDDKLVPYVVAGIGYAAADLERPIQGTVNGQNVSIGDDSGFTANAGVGIKYFVSDQFLLRLEGRYRYLDAVVDNFDTSLNTFETTLGVGWKF